MDIMNVLGKIGFDFSVFIYNLINFSILAFLLQKFFFKKAISTMEKRQLMIAEGLKQAENAVQTVEKAELQKLGIIKKAKVEADSIVETAAKKAKETSVVLSEKAKDEILNMKAKAKVQIEQEKLQMVEDFKAEAVNIVFDTAAKVAKSGNTSINSAENALAN